MIKQHHVKYLTYMYHLTQHNKKWVAEKTIECDFLQADISEHLFSKEGCLKITVTNIKWEQTINLAIKCINHSHSFSLSNNTFRQGHSKLSGDISSNLPKILLHTAMKILKLILDPKQTLPDVRLLIKMSHKHLISFLHF